MAEQEKDQVKVPEAPAILPAAEKAEWTKRYAAAFEEAESEFGDDTAARHGYSLRAANRMLSVPKLRSLEEANKLPRWKVLVRGTRKDGATSIVTIDGKKYLFPKAASQGETGGNGNGQGGQQPPKPPATT